MLAKEWRLCIYTIILMTVSGTNSAADLLVRVGTDRTIVQWFNFYSHTSQDSYTTFLRTEKGMNNAVASTASILMKTGACVGGTIIGYLSQWVGRRRAMCVAALISACLIPAWVLPNKFGSLAASGFMLQFFVQGISHHSSSIQVPADISSRMGCNPNPPQRTLSAGLQINIPWL
jgi:MFS family permease